MPHLPVRGRDRVVELPPDGRAVPASPAELTPRGAEIWSEIWQSPVSDLWSPSDAGLVRRLVGLRERLETDMSAPASLYSAALHLKRSLALTPQSRHAFRIVIGASSPARRRSAKSAENMLVENGQRRLTARQRDRLLRG